MTAELTPCPFCGNLTPQIDTSSVGFHAVCLQCGMASRGYDTKAQAIAAWNTRQPSSAAQEYDETELINHTITHTATLLHAIAEGKPHDDPFVGAELEAAAQAILKLRNSAPLPDDVLRAIWRGYFTHPGDGDVVRAWLDTQRTQPEAVDEAACDYDVQP